MVAVVAKLTVYGFCDCEGRFAELLGILEKKRGRLPNLRGEFGHEERCRPVGSRRSGSAARLLPN